MASGEWRVASGEWRVASGEWRVVSGEWRVVSGEWRVASELSSPSAVFSSIQYSFVSQIFSHSQLIEKGQDKKIETLRF